tara:strand:- start:11 stop:670 length:660 start_codon:yes stop_codon:yes gene_type:complete
MLYNITNVDSEILRDELIEREKGIDLSNYFFQNNLLSKEQIDKVIKIAEPRTHRATTFSGVDESFRKSNITWINPVERLNSYGENEGSIETVDNTWLYKIVADFAIQANEKIYNFDIYGMFESIQYTVYDGTEQGFYCAHVDHGENFYKRKLSVVIQLTDPNEYEGGDLLLHTGKSPHVIGRGLGNVVVFPSWMLHEVTPVTKGTRRSLVCWVSGPPYK